MKRTNTATQETRNTTTAARIMKAATEARITRIARKATEAAKAASFYIILFIMLTVCSTIEANAGTIKQPTRISNTAGKAQAPRISNAAKVSRQDLKAIRKYTADEYPGFLVKIAPAEATPDHVIETRAGKRTVYIDQFKTKSRGRYGIVTRRGPFKGRRIRYNRKHAAGKTIMIYVIYNPNSNYIDDTPASIETGKIYRAE